MEKYDEEWDEEWDEDDESQWKAEEIKVFRRAWKSAKESGCSLVDYGFGYFMTGSFLNKEEESEEYKADNMYWSETGRADSSLVEFKDWESFETEFMKADSRW